MMQRELRLGVDRPLEADARPVSVATRDGVTENEIIGCRAMEK